MASIYDNVPELGGSRAESSILSQAYEMLTPDALASVLGDETESAYEMAIERILNVFMEAAEKRPNGFGMSSGIC